LSLSFTPSASCGFGVVFSLYEFAYGIFALPVSSLAGHRRWNPRTRLQFFAVRRLLLGTASMMRIYLKVLLGQHAMLDSSTRRTRILTSMRAPSLFRIDMRRSTVNRPRSAFRMREKSAAAKPVLPCAARTVIRSRSSALMISGRKGRLDLLGVRVFCAQVAEYVSAPAHHLEFFAFHRNISLSFFKRSLIRSASCFGVLTPCVDFFWNAWTT
jgi:hypothetical protein